MEPHPLRSWRKANGYNLKALAARTSVGPTQISQIETGAKRASPELVRELVEITGLAPRVIRPDLAELFEGGGQ